MDLVLRLRELRRLSGLCQRDASRLSGVGVKTLSSFETGARIEAMKISKLHRILRAYGSTEAEFFGADLESVLGSDAVSEMIPGAQRLSSLPPHVRRALIERIELMIDAACVAMGFDLPRVTSSASLRGRLSAR